MKFLQVFISIKRFDTELVIETRVQIARVTDFLMDTEPLPPSLSRKLHQYLLAQMQERQKC